MHLLGLDFFGHPFMFSPARPLQETAAGRKAAHREVKLRLKQEKLARENACKKVRTF